MLCATVLMSNSLFCLRISINLPFTEFRLVFLISESSYSCCYQITDVWNYDDNVQIAAHLAWAFVMYEFLIIIYMYLDFSMLDNWGLVGALGRPIKTVLLLVFGFFFFFGSSLNIKLNIYFSGHVLPWSLLGCATKTIFCFLVVLFLIDVHNNSLYYRGCTSRQIQSSIKPGPSFWTSSGWCLR